MQNSVELKMPNKPSRKERQKAKAAATAELVTGLNIPKTTSELRRESGVTSPTDPGNEKVWRPTPPTLAELFERDSVGERGVFGTGQQAAAAATGGGGGTLNRGVFGTGQQVSQSQRWTPPSQRANWRK